MITITVRAPFAKKVDKLEIIDTANSVLINLFGEKKINLSILICSDKVIAKYNFQYRSVNSPTDVLSFESNTIDPESNLLNLGDIVLSYETAEKQAIDACHSTNDELLVLLIHGILHLSGYDHDTKKNKETMWKKQFEIHRMLDIKIASLSGDND
jgi:probable rRNA maturation factor